MDRDKERSDCRETKRVRGGERTQYKYLERKRGSQPEQRVHLLRLTRTKTFSVAQTRRPRDERDKLSERKDEKNFQGEQLKVKMHERKSERERETIKVNKAVQ